MSTPNPTPGGGWVPVPDPTALTNQAISDVTTEYRREIDQLRELIEARLDAMDASRAALVRESGRLRDQIEEKIVHLRELTDERFTGVDRRFEDRDARLTTHDSNGQKALTAALESAQKISEQHDRYNEEAISKAQTAINEKIGALEQVGATSRDALEDKIDDARTRITTIESLTRGIEHNTDQRRLNSGQLIALAAVILVGVGVIVSVVSVIAHK